MVGQLVYVVQKICESPEEIFLLSEVGAHINFCAYAMVAPSSAGA
jgi:hypothetical protein